MLLLTAADNDWAAETRSEYTRVCRVVVCRRVWSVFQNYFSDAWTKFVGYCTFEVGSSQLDLNVVNHFDVDSTGTLTIATAAIFTSIN